MFLQRLHDAVVFLLHVERRFEPFFRPAVDAVLREPFALLTQALINLGRHDEGLRLAEEKIQPMLVVLIGESPCDCDSVASWRARTIRFPKTRTR